MNKAEDYLQAAQIHPVGEAAIMVSFGNVINPELLRCARALVKALEEDPSRVSRNLKLPIRG